MKLNVSIVGATGAVGQEMLKILKEREFPLKSLRVFASNRSEGKRIAFGDQILTCEKLSRGCFKGAELVFFDASDAVSREWAPRAEQEGAWVMDHSGAFRMDPDIPLLVPEVNPQALENRKGRLIAGPNCTTIQLVMALAPLHRRFGLKRVLVSTYQSTSGAGLKAMQALRDQTQQVLHQEPITDMAPFPHPIAFNCIPQIGAFQEDGYTSEEHKIILESQKILGTSFSISATCVRVPTLYSHCESVSVELHEPFTSLKEIHETFSTPGLQIWDDPKSLQYPMPAVSIPGTYPRDSVLVGRIRQDLSVKNGIHLWVVSDNLRKGAALNAIQIGELLVDRQVFKS